jgi:hypothetical protein
MSLFCHIDLRIANAWQHMHCAHVKATDEEFSQILTVLFGPYFKYEPCGPQQALENSGLSVVQSQSSGAPAQSQGQPTEGATADNKKTLGQERSAKERKRSIFRKPIQMPGRIWLASPLV